MKKLHVAAAVVLAAAAVIVYHNALSASFFDDDFQWLVGSWSFDPSQLVAFGTMNHFYRPVIDLYFAAATPLFGGSPVLFHFANIVLHAANALVVFALARQIALYGPAEAGPHDPSGPSAGLFGFLAALFFVVQPSDVDAIAWVGALAEAVALFFGCLGLLCFLKWRHDGRAAWRVLSVVAFLLALLTHESSVVFLPVMMVADWTFGETSHGATETRRTLQFLGRRYWPYITLTVAYLGIDLWINSRNYVVSQGHYTIGLHVVRNALNYIDALYVGRRNLANYAVIAIGTALLLLFGSRRVRFATLWMLFALAPFVLFNWGNTSRYLYQPAVGFSMLLAEGVLFLDRLMRPRIPTPARIAVVASISGVIAIRFAFFAIGNVKDFSDRSQVYPQYIARFREIHGDLPSHTVVAPDPRLEVKLPYQFVNAAVQWEYKDPTIQITPYEY